MKTENTKKSLKLSGLSLFLCIVLLVGTTFAWFTDSVTNSGNKIQAGNLDIGAKAYEVGAGGDIYTISGINGGKPFTFSSAGQDLEKDTAPIINDSLFEPGKTYAKLLEVTNKGSLAAKIKLDFSISDGGLANALWFDFIRVENGNVIGDFTKRPMTQLKTLADNIEINLTAKENAKFILVYGMNEDAGNKYQDKTFAADVNIIAAQAAYENDGFGNNQYDKDAGYNVIEVTADDNIVDVVAEAKDNAIIKLSQGMVLTGRDNMEIKGNKSITLDLNGNTLTIENDSSKPINVEKDSSLYISNGQITTDKASYCVVNSGTLSISNVKINNSKVYGSGIDNNGELTVVGSEIIAQNRSIYNYNATIKRIDNCKIISNTQNAIHNLGANTIEEITNSEISALNPGSLTYYALNNTKDSRVNKIENCVFYGAISKMGYIGIVSGVFENTGMQLEDFERMTVQGSTATEKDGIFTVIKG